MGAGLAKPEPVEIRDWTTQGRQRQDGRLAFSCMVSDGEPAGKLTGDRAGQHSIQINQQWRICFIWSEAGPDEVEIVDYH
jgi:hypothetical protein